MAILQQQPSASPLSGILAAAKSESESNLTFKSSRPIYAIILLLVSGFSMCMTFFPILYSVVFPNENLQRFIGALEGREAPPLNADTAVQQTIAAVGTLKRTIRIGHSWQLTSKTHYAEPWTTEKIEMSQDVDIAWFEQHPEPMLVAIACYEYGDGHKAYGISQVSPLVVVRAYAIPLGFFCISLFLVRKRRSPVSAR
jgi:hypothetical protein